MDWLPVQRGVWLSCFTPKKHVDNLLSNGQPQLKQGLLFRLNRLTTHQMSVSSCSLMLFHRMKTSEQNQVEWWLHIRKLGLRVIQTVGWDVKMSQSKWFIVHTVLLHLKHQIMYLNESQGSWLHVVWSPHVLIMRTLCQTGKWKQCIPGQMSIELNRWEIESENPHQPQERTNTFKCVTQAKLKGLTLQFQLS